MKALATLAILGLAYGSEENNRLRGNFVRGVDKNTNQHFQTLLKVGSKIAGLDESELFSLGKLFNDASNKVDEVKQETKNLGEKTSQDVKNDKLVKNAGKMLSDLGFDDHTLFEWGKLLNEAANKVGEVKQETKNLGDKTAKDIKNDQFIKNAEKMYNELMSLGLEDNSLFEWGKFINDASKKVDEVKQETKNLGEKTSQDVKNDKLVKNAGKMLNDLGFDDNDLFSLGKFINDASNKVDEVKQETKNLGEKTSQDVKNDKLVKNAGKMLSDLGFDDNSLFEWGKFLNEAANKVGEVKQETKNLGEKTTQDIKNDQFIKNAEKMYNELMNLGLVDNNLFEWGKLLNDASKKVDEVKQETKNLGDKTSEDIKNDQLVKNAGKMLKDLKSLGLEDSSLFDLQKLLSDASKTVGDAKKSPKNYGDLLNDAIDIVKDIKRKDDFEDSHFMRPNYNTGRPTGGKMWGY